LSLAAFASVAPLAGSRETMEPAVQSTAERRRELYALLGDLPDRQRPIGGRKRSERIQDGIVIETWDLDLNGLETTPAYLARPASVSGRTPAIVFNHSHGGGYTIGKQEMLDGRTYLQPVPYAKALTDLGYTVLCIDHWVFGERSHTSELDACGRSTGWRGEPMLTPPGSPPSACQWAARWPGGWRRSTSASKSRWTSAA
jgi:hypothetical protein